MSSISFFCEDINFTLPNAKKTENWIRKVIRQEGFKLLHINYVFCSDDYLHRLNLQYLSHDNYTDILTFNHSDDKKELLGDIYISVERVRENAGSLKNPFEQELHRVMIHGILHLLGYSDKSGDEKTAMRKKEDSCLSLYFG